MSRTEQESKISEQIAFGVSPQEVASYHGMSVRELMDKFGHIVNRAAVDLDVEVARRFYQLAMGIETSGNAQACANWLKSRCQWDKLMDKKEFPSEDKVIKKVVIETIGPEESDNDTE